MFPLTPDQHHWLDVATEDEGWCSFRSCTPSRSRARTRYAIYEASYIANDRVERRDLGGVISKSARTTNKVKMTALTAHMQKQLFRNMCSVIGLLVNKRLSCRRETARCFVSLNTSLSYPRLLNVIRNDTLKARYIHWRQSWIQHGRLWAYVSPF